MKKLLCSILLGLGICTLSFADAKSAIPSLNNNVTSQAVDPKSVDLTFTISATHARLILENAGSHTYRLILEGITPYITYITGRPGRITGLAELGNFIRAWTVGGNSFANNNPNAILSAGYINGSPNQGNAFYILQLAKPGFDQERGVLEFLAKPIGTNQTILSEMDYQYANLVIS